MEFSFLSDVGKKRELDEDSIVALKIATVHESKVSEMGVFVLADGMGGHNAGEIASRIASRTVASIITKDLLTGNKRNKELIIRTAIKEANEILIRYAKERPECEGMGTTLTLALVEDGEIYVGNVGDSRAYLVNDEEIRQITKDHSLVQEMIDKGVITLEEARNHPQKNIITRALGVSNSVEVDTFRLKLYEEDYLLLCCDGLSDVVEDKDIQKVILKSDSLSMACNKLVDLANSKGGPDNISVILIRDKKLPSRKKLLSQKTKLLEKSNE